MAAQNSGADFTEPQYTKSNNKVDVPYYYPNIDSKLVPETRELLEKYSHVPPEQQSEHVHKIRDQAWDIRAYPCIGLGAFLTPQLCRLPVYPDILARVKGGAKLVDVGTFIGHDLRRLVYDGAPSDNLYGVDIVSHFDVGYDFFRDRETFKGHFIEADLFASSTSPALSELKGQVDVIIASQVLHLWNWDGQLKAAEALTAFTKPGSWVAGNQIGHPEPKDFASRKIPGGVYFHNPASFTKLWNIVGEATGTRWEVQAWMRTLEELGWEQRDAAWMTPGACVMEYVAKRTS